MGGVSTRELENGSWDEPHDLTKWLLALEASASKTEVKPIALHIEMKITSACSCINDLDLL